MIILCYLGVRFLVLAPIEKRLGGFFASRHTDWVFNNRLGAECSEKQAKAGTTDTENGCVSGCEYCKHA